MENREKNFKNHLHYLARSYILQKLAYGEKAENTASPVFICGKNIETHGNV